MVDATGPEFMKEILQIQKKVIKKNKKGNDWPNLKDRAKCSGRTSSSEQILGHQLTFLRLSSNIAGAIEDASVCTLLFGERERKLDYVTSPVFNKLYIESPYGVTWVCLIFWLTSNPFIWVSSLTFCKQDSFILLSIYSHNRKVLVILPLKTSRNKLSTVFPKTLSLKSQTNTNKKAKNQIISKLASREPTTIKKSITINWKV